MRVAIAEAVAAGFSLALRVGSRRQGPGRPGRGAPDRWPRSRAVGLVRFRAGCRRTVGSARRCCLCAGSRSSSSLDVGTSPLLGARRRRRHIIGRPQYRSDRRFAGTAFGPSRFVCAAPALSTVDYGPLRSRGPGSLVASRGRPPARPEARQTPDRRLGTVAVGQPPDRAVQASSSRSS